MDKVANILNEKGIVVHTTQPQTKVLDAVEEMCARRVGALLVCEQSVPVGIFSERDLMTKVVLPCLDPATTPVGAVMTSEVVCIEPTASIGEAMAVMTQRRCRHLPVVSGTTLVGMLSIGDLVRWGSRNQEHEIRMLIDYIHGKYPG